MRQLHYTLVVILASLLVSSSVAQSNCPNITAELLNELGDGTTPIDVQDFKITCSPPDTTAGRFATVVTRHSRIGSSSREHAFIKLQCTDGGWVVTSFMTGKSDLYGSVEDRITHCAECIDEATFNSREYPINPPNRLEYNKDTHCLKLPKCFKQDGTLIGYFSTRECCLEKGHHYMYEGGSFTCIVHGFTQTEYSVMEGNTVDIVYKRNVKGETTFPLLTIQGSITSSSGGSGTTSDDYESVSVRLVRQDETKTFTVTVNDDDVALEEGDTIILTHVSTIPNYVIRVEEQGEFISHTAKVTIIDKDSMQFQVETSYTVSEDDDQDQVLSITWENVVNQVPVVLEITSEMLEDGSVSEAETATAGQDFVADTLEVVIPPNTAGGYSISLKDIIVEDSTVENRFQLFNLGITSLTSGVIFVTSNSNEIETKVAIESADTAEVQLDASVAQFCENTEGPFDVCVFVRSGENSDCPVEFQTNYTISFTRLSESTNDSDDNDNINHMEDQICRNVTIEPCSTTACIDLKDVFDITDDDEFHLQSFNISLLPDLSMGKVEVFTNVIEFEDDRLCQCFATTDCSGDVVSAASQRDCCVTTENGLSFNTGSDCNICIVHGFNRSCYYVLEEERLDTVFQLNVKGTTAFDALIITGIITTAADGTASDSDFERLAPIRVTNRVDIRLFTANDEITLEYDDRVLLTFTPDNSALIPGIEGLGEYIRDTATVHIIDNDQLQINFGESDYRIEEDSGILITPITLQFRENQNPFTVILTPVEVGDIDSLGLRSFINPDNIGDTSRATAGDDFSQNGTTVTVPANRKTFQIPQFFTVVDDDIDEDEQSFVLVAEIGEDVPDKFAIIAETGYEVLENVSCFQLGVGRTECFGRRGATQIKIDDDDPMIIGFTERIRYVSEGQEGAVDLFQLQIEVNSVRTAERRHRMEFRLLEGSTNATVESLISLSNIFDARFGQRENPDDPLEETRDLPPGERTIPSNRLLVTTIRNDFMSEDLECYTIRIFPVEVPGRRELFTCYEDSAMADNYFCEHTICIEDNDEPFEVKFVETTYTVNENMGGVNVCVNLTKPETDILDETVQVSVVDYPSSVHIPVGAQLANPDTPDFLSRYLMVEGSDYAQQTMTVNAIDDILISQLMRVICYNQPIYDDPCVELDEYAGLSLRVPEGTISPPPCDQASILILDNDRAVVGLQLTFFNVLEDVGQVQLCAVVSEPDITCPIKFPFEVELSTSDGTAVQTMDYGAIDVTLMFDACEKRKCVNVNITDDMIPEQNESFTYHLRRTPDLHERISLNPVDGRVNITDNDDQITVGYDPTSYMMSESAGSVTLTIRVFSHPMTGAPQPFTLVVDTQDGTATVADGDYVPVAGEIIQFNAGDVTRTHTIFINDDDECEKDPNENLFSRIALENSIPGITVTVPQAEVTINDIAEPECEPITVGYAPDSYVTTETDGSVTLTIRVFSHPTTGAPRPFTLVVNTQDGTATVADGDYLPVTGEIIQFNTGDTTQTHTIIINDDEECEKDPNENFLSNIALENSIPDIAVTVPQAMVTIDDTAEPECEPITVGYDPDSYVTTETDGSVTLNIRVFSHPAGAPRPFTLVVNTEDGTATEADGDYVPVAGEIVQFNAGDMTRTHTIIINDDNICEENPNENFFSNIALDSGIPDITVTVPRAMVTIDDSVEVECDPIEVGYEFSVYSTPEGAGFVTLCAVVTNFPGGSPRPFTISATTEDGSAVSGSDYVGVVDVPLMFATGATRVCHDVEIIDDNECETPYEDFFSNLEYDSGVMPIIITRDRTQVIINDTAEPECDPITVGYDPDSYVTTETDGSVTLSIRVFSHPAGAPRPFTLVVNTEDGTATVADGDYVPVPGEIVQFNTGDVTKNHTIIINNDDVCEIEPANENFFSNIALDSGIPNITVTVPRAMVNIDDTAEPECGRNTVFVNDTLTGDPLLTVPIFTDPDVEPGDDIESLCYRVHGEDGACFNLISDGCTSVNGYYQEAVTPSENIDLNVVTQIGVRARGNSACWNIQVDLDMCNTTVNGMPLASTTNDGISVKHYATSSRVRIAVPNCDDDTMLVMWVFCRSGRVEDPVTREYFSIRFVRFVVMRGLNLDSQSHGLIGQFWNVPVTISSYTGLFGGEERTDDYIITVDHPQSDPRSFVGLKSDVTWEFEKRVCYYVGNTQAGKLAEVADPNDSVIEGDYNDYKVDSLFATDFKYSHFDETQC